MLYLFFLRKSTQHTITSPSILQPPQNPPQPHPSPHPRQPRPQPIQPPPPPHQRPHPLLLAPSRRGKKQRLIGPSHEHQRIRHDPHRQPRRRQPRPPLLPPRARVVRGVEVVRGREQRQGGTEGFSGVEEVRPLREDYRGGGVVSGGGGEGEEGRDEEVGYGVEGALFWSVSGWVGELKGWGGRDLPARKADRVMPRP